MKKPEILAPPSTQVMFRIIKLRDEIEQNFDLQAFFKRANDEYWPWEIFKHKRPEKCSYRAEDLWFYLKYFTRKRAKMIPAVKDLKKRPFGYTLTGKIQEYLHIIDTTLSGNILSQKFISLDIQLKKEQQEWKTKRIINSLIEEAITSSQIEGAATSRRRARELLKSGGKPRTNDEKMILNNYLAMQQIKEGLMDKPLSIEMIKDIQTRLTIDTSVAEKDVGQFRQDIDENDMVGVYDSSDNSILHTPPPAKEIVSRLNGFCAFVNDDSEFMHPIIKGILIHFYLAYIHPFYDGNGRTARGLFYWYALKKGYDLFEYISISEYIKKRLTGYLKAYLYTELDDNDLTYFIMYNLQTIMLALRDIEKYVRNKLAEHFALKEKAKNIQGLNVRQLDIVNHSLKHPDQRYTIQSHLHSNNISWATARRDLLGLSDKRLLEKKLLGKELYFFVPEDLKHILNG
jgi:Fic family protein